MNIDLQKIADRAAELPDEPGGLMACSPELYRQMQEMVPLPEIDAPSQVWLARLQAETNTYRIARRAHSDAVSRKASAVRRKAQLKRTLISRLHEQRGVAISRAEKEYVDEPEWGKLLDEIELLDLEIVDLDAERAVATHDRETVLAAFERVTMEMASRQMLIVPMATPDIMNDIREKLDATKRS